MVSTQATEPTGTKTAVDTAPGIPAYLAALASSAPAPGGGSAAALVGAMAAALVSMVANLTVGRRKFAAVEPSVRAALGAAEHVRAQLLSLMEEDERVFRAAIAAYKLPHTTDEEQYRRTQAIQQAVRAAAQPPLAMAAASRRTLDLAGIVAKDGNPQLASDAGVAALLAEAALRASAINVRVNLAQLRDEHSVAETEAALNQLLEGTPSLTAEILAISGRRMAGE